MKAVADAIRREYDEKISQQEASEAARNLTGFFSLLQTIQQEHESPKAQEGDASCK